MDTLLTYIFFSSSPLKTPALRTVGNIVTGDDIQTQIIINCNALPFLLSMLSSMKKGIRKEACWTISNITAGNKDQVLTWPTYLCSTLSYLILPPIHPCLPINLPIQIKAVFDANIIPLLIGLLTQAEFDIKKEAAWAISNATSGGTPEQIKFLVQQGTLVNYLSIYLPT